MSTGAGKCHRCGGTRLQHGRVRAPRRLTFVPDNTIFWTLSTPDVALDAYLCMDCGAVELFGDLEKAKRLLPQVEGRDENP
jgi:DNA-directed RNA polymerase subunit RPC12/RpoP